MSVLDLEEIVIVGSAVAHVKRENYKRPRNYYITYTFYMLSGQVIKVGGSNQQEEDKIEEFIASL